eukprot:3296870-Pyramimonas_sp.AAC.1
MGPTLFTLLDDVAARAMEIIDMDDLETEGGEQVLFDTLDARFPDVAAHDRLGEALQEVFSLKLAKHEAIAAHGGRAQATFAKGEAEGVVLPDMARGYVLLLGAHLPPQCMAVVLAASSRSHKERDVASALRTTSPNGTTDFGQQQKTYHAHVVDDEEDGHVDIETLMTGLQEDGGRG